MPPCDMSGLRFGKLTVRGISHRAHSQIYWHCVCDCGTECVVAVTNLRYGKTRSCGCLRRNVGERAKTHGMHRSREYRSWNGMIQRCENPRAPNYDRYGGKGVKVCKRWRRFENFYADMGERPIGKTLDRIKSTGDYKPSNCRWATPKEQASNRSRPWVSAEATMS